MGCAIRPRLCTESIIYREELFDLISRQAHRSPSEYTNLDVLGVLICVVNPISLSEISMLHELMQRELVIDLDTGNYDIKSIAHDVCIIGPVDYG